MIAIAWWKSPAIFWRSLSANHAAMHFLPDRHPTYAATTRENLFWTGQSKDLEELGRLAQEVRQGSLCGLGRTAPNPVISTLTSFS